MQKVSDNDLKHMAVIMTDCMSIMETGRCPTCGSAVKIEFDDDGFVDCNCPNCKARYGFSPEFFE